MQNLYYTPTIEEFHVGFHYEMKESFCDGTVKSQTDFDNAQWIKRICDGGNLPYIERALGGRNAAKGLCGIRVKYLDKTDIENCDWYFKSQLTTESNNHYFWDKATSTHSLIYFYKKHHAIITIRDTIQKIDLTSFVGTIKNINQLQNIMKMIEI